MLIRPVLLIPWISIGRGGCGGPGDGVGEAEVLSFCVGPWRIKGNIATFGVLWGLWLLARLCYLCCCGRFAQRRRGCGEARSNYGAAFSGIFAGFPVYADGGGISIRFFLPTWRTGLVLAPTSFGGFLPLRGVLLVGLPGWLMVVAPGFLWSGDVRVIGLLFWHVRSVGKKNVSDTGVLLLMPFKTFKSSSSEGWSASTRLFRPPATRMTGKSLQRLECNFLFSQGCLCKSGVVNHQKYL